MGKDYDKEVVELLYSGLMTVAKKVGGAFGAENWAMAGSKYLSRGEVLTRTFSIARTAKSVLIEGNAPTRICFLSIDIEGSEFSVLDGLKFSNWIFEYILIETSEGSPAFLKLIQSGYKHIESIKQNLLFVHPSMI